MSDSRHRSGDRTGPDRDLASGLAAVSSGLPGTLFRYLLRPDGSDAIWYVSAGCTELFELSAAEIEADLSRLWALIDADCVPRLRASIADSAARLSEWRDEYRITTPSGRRKWIQAHGKPMPWPEGGTVWTTLLLDITDQREAERKVAVSEARLRALLERIDAIAVQGYDRERRVFLWNAASERLYGYSAAEAIGQRLEDLIIPPPARQGVIDEVEGWIRHGRPIPSAELSLCDRRGQPVEVFSSHALLENADGAPEMFCIDIDIRERNRAVEALRRSEARLSQVLAVIGEGIWDWDIFAGSVHVNARWLAIMGLPETGLQRSVEDFKRMLHPADRSRVLQRLEHCLRGEAPYACEFRMLRADGSEIWVEDRGEVVERDAQGRALRMIGSLTDISARKQAEQQAQFVAYFDPLTALPNRRLLEERLSRALEAAATDGSVGALLMLDLDDFRRVNESRGHSVGDRLLQAVAIRLGALLRGGDTLARPGGDEFLLLLPSLSTDPEAARDMVAGVLVRLREALDEPIEIDGQRCSTGVSFGITFYPGAGGSAADLLREADTALYLAKSAGRGQAVRYDAAMSGQLSQRMQLELDLREALKHGQFVLHAQSEVHADGSVAGAELLLRWQHPQRGRLAPGEFIDAAERTGIIVGIGDWVLGEGCRAAARMAAAGIDLPLSINVSPRQFHQPDFVERVRTHLRAHGTNPAQVILEVTENLLIDDVEQAAQRMRELSALGLRFSIDDFGTGFSSLAYLKRLPLYQLKIDRSFVKDTPGDASDCAIVKLVISMAASLGLSVVAEGVETREQAAFLQGSGCSLQQGYLYARPEPLETWLARLGVDADARFDPATRRQ